MSVINLSLATSIAHAGNQLLWGYDESMDPELQEVGGGGKGKEGSLPKQFPRPLTDALCSALRRRCSTCW